MHDFWEEYKYKISTPIAITLSVFGTATSLLTPHFVIFGSTMGAITNISVFFVSILLSKWSTENLLLEDNNKILKNENKRLTVIYNSQAISEKSNDSVEPVNFENIHRDNIIKNYTFPNE